MQAGEAALEALDKSRADHKLESAELKQELAQVKAQVRY